MRKKLQSKPLRRAVIAGLAAGVFAAAPWGEATAASNPVPVFLTKDKVAGREGVFRGGSGFTAPGGGKSGAAGDYAVDFTPRNTGPVHVADASFFNTGAANDQLTVAFWTKKYDTAAGSAFWANSPSSNNGLRGYQAHVPWSDNVVYFDSAGCCGADTRISANIDTFTGYTGDIGFWTNSWHHFAFTKNGASKQIWIDGQLFTEGAEAAPLPQDFTELFIGASSAGGGFFHGLIDDFAVFSTQLTEAQLQQIANGTSPSALPSSAGLLAFWDFNDFPPEGYFQEVLPTPNTTSGSANTIRVVHVDGSTPWTQQNVSLAIDGAPVTAQVQKDGGKATVTYVSPTLFAIQSKHKATLTYPGPNGPQTLEWEFVVGPYTKDTVGTRLGTFTGGSGYTGDAGGRTGQPGDYGLEFGRSGSGPVQITDVAFLNAAAANDEVSFALWLNKYDIAASSAFWGVSPSSSSNQRGYQAHVPWSDNRIYFDTAGCCDGATQRISESLDVFPDYTGDVSWWQQWHHFVFSKKGEVKQVWIDGKLFFEGVNTSPLPTDFTRLVLGADDVGGNLIHAVMDDFAVFSKQLTEADATALFSGTAPTALPASAGLVAFWNFNDIPPQGIFLSFSPTPDSTNAAPDLIQVVHLQGTTAWDLSKVSLKVDGTPVTATTTKDGSRVTVKFTPNPIFTVGSTHTATLNYPNPDGTTGTQEWSFVVAPYTLDTTHKYVGRLIGPTKFTADAGGRSGNAGDYAVDLGKIQAGQGVHLGDPTPLNTAAAADEIAIVGWQKLHSVANSAFFFGVSPGSNGGRRGFGAFPWGDSNIYYDTAGCCDAGSQRISANIDTFPNYTDASFWTNWHHFVYQKKGTLKEVWIDGILFMSGENTSPLPTDFIESYIGVDVPDNARLQGLVDDFAIFGTALDEATIGKLANGDAPSTLPAAAKLLAYWNFNDATSGPVERPTISVATAAAGKIRLTYTGALESADAANGTWSTVNGATSPWEVDTAAAPVKFYRAKK